MYLAVNILCFEYFVKQNDGICQNFSLSILPNCVIICFIIIMLEVL